MPQQLRKEMNLRDESIREPRSLPDVKGQEVPQPGPKGARHIRPAQRPGWGDCSDPFTEPHRGVRSEREGTILGQSDDSCGALGGESRRILKKGLEAPPGFEPGMEVLQTSALPLGYGADFVGLGAFGRGLVSHGRVVIALRAPSPGPQATAGILRPAFLGRRMERETGFEPATSTLARSHSTTELFPPGTSAQCNKRAAISARRPKITVHDRSTRAASSGVTGLMAVPLPRSNPDGRSTRGTISRCQW